MPTMRDIKTRKLAAMAASGAASAAVAGHAAAPATLSGPGAALAGGRGDHARSPADQAAHLMEVRLLEDRRRLKEIESTERKIEAKRTMLPEYDSWVRGQMEGELPPGQRNDVLTTVMVWLLDTGDFAPALEIAEKVLASDVPLPSQFERKAPTLIAEEVAEGVFTALRANAAFDRADLEFAMALTEAHDMPDQVRAKLFKARTRLLIREADAVEEAGGEQADGPAGKFRALLNDALADAQRAIELDKDCGAKTLHRDLERRIKKLGPPPSGDD